MYVKFIEDKKFVLLSFLSFINLERNFHKMKNEKLRKFGPNRPLPSPGSNNRCGAEKFRDRS